MVSTGEQVKGLKTSELAVLLSEKAEEFRRLANIKEGFTKADEFQTIDMTKLETQLKTIRADIEEIITAIP